MRTIDAHQHFWHYSAAEYGWIDDSMSVLRRDFLPRDFETDSGGMESIAVQARETMEETEWLLGLAKEHPGIAGVVGWVDLKHSQVGEVLDRLANDARFRGVREILQGCAPGTLRDTNFRTGLGQLASRGLVYDLLIFQNQLDEAIELVDAFPNQIFVLDHAAKPRIRDRVTEPWAAKMKELARRDHVFCKVSGLVTEADWAGWTPAHLQPYVDLVLEVFGVQRVMFGSDWPVCCVAGGHERWRQALEVLCAELSADEGCQLYGGTAIRAYQLPIL